MQDGGGRVRPVVVDGVGCRLNFKSSRVTVGTSKTARKLGISFPFVADATQASAAQVEEQVRARSGFNALAARVAADLAANRAAADDALVEPSSAEPAQAAAWLQEKPSASNDVIERGKRSRQQVELFQPDGDGLRNFAMGHGGCFGRGDRPLGACRGAAGLKLEAPEQQRRFHQVTVTVTG